MFEIGEAFCVLTTVNSINISLLKHGQETRRGAVTYHALLLTFPGSSWILSSCLLHPGCRAQPLLVTTWWVREQFFSVAKLLTAVAYFILAAPSLLKAFFLLFFYAMFTSFSNSINICSYYCLHRFLCQVFTK